MAPLIRTRYPRSVEFRKLAEVPPLRGWSPVSRNVSLQGDALLLYVSAGASGLVRAIFAKAGGRFPASRMEASQSFLFVRISESNRTDVELPKLNVTFPLIDTFPDGRILVAGARSRWLAEGIAEQNGNIVDTNTGQCSQILLGDGIANVAVDADGRIWAGYFDEGIFGNFGWGSPGPEPVGSHGLACFTPEGRVAWEFPLNDEFGPISDCYALNVTSMGVFACFFTQFPLCRIDGEFRREYWQFGLKGCSQFAIDDARVLFSGQYEDPPGTAYLADFVRGKHSEVQQLTLSLPDDALQVSGTLIGRGSGLHYFSDDSWYRLDLADV